MKKFLLTLLLCLTLGTASVWAEEQVAFELKFDKYTNSSNVSNYTSTWNQTYGDYTWEIVNFNNNNQGNNDWTYVKAITKTSLTASMSTQTKATEAIKSIVVNMGKCRTSTFSSITLDIADNQDFTNAKSISVPVPADWSSLAASTSSPTLFDHTISIDDPQPDKFYKITFTFSSASGNGSFQVNSIQYLYDDTPADPTEPCGEIIFTPADGKVLEGGAIKIACKNAETIKYTIDGGDELIYDDATGIVINTACTIIAWGINGVGVEGEKSTLNVTIKEPDQYVLINRVSDIKPGARYILFGMTKSSTDKVGALMCGISGSYCTGISGIVFDNIISINEDEITGLNVFQLAPTTSGNYSIQFTSDNKYLGISGTDFTTSTTSTDWEITFSNDEVKIKSNGATIFYNSSTNPVRFKPYTSNTMSPVYLYRLIDDEYYTDKAPAELHIHGSHFTGSWAASSQFDQATPGVFTFNGFLAYEDSDAAPALVFSTAAFSTPGNTEVTGIRHRKAAPAADYWNDIEGDVFMPETDGATVGTHKLVRVSTADLAAGTATLNTFAADHNTSYDLTVDFNGYSPVATLAAHDENNVPTGVENIDAAETTEVEYYNLSGLRVANPENGIFIRRQGNKVTKVLVK